MNNQTPSKILKCLNDLNGVEATIWYNGDIDLSFQERTIPEHCYKILDNEIHYNYMGMAGSFYLPKS